MDSAEKVSENTGLARHDPNVESSILPPPMAERFSSTSLLAVGRGQQHHSRTTSTAGEHSGTNGPSIAAQTIGGKPEVRKPNSEQMYAEIFDKFSVSNLSSGE